MRRNRTWSYRSPTRQSTRRQFAQTAGLCLTGGLVSSGCDGIDGPTRQYRPSQRSIDQSFDLDSAAATDELVDILTSHADRSAKHLADIASEYSLQNRQSAAQQLFTTMMGFSAQTQETIVGGHLEALRAIGPVSLPHGERLIPSVLYPPARLFHGRAKSQISRIRGFALVTLVEIGIVTQPIPALLKHLYAYSNAYEFASGARCARSIIASRFVPELINGLARFDHHGDLHSLDRYDRKYPSSEATTSQIESIRALAAHGSLARDAVPKLQRIQQKVLNENDPVRQRVANAVAAALERIQ